MSVSALSLVKAPTDSLEIEKDKKWHEQLTKDFYLREAVNVLADISQKN